MQIQDFCLVLTMYDELISILSKAIGVASCYSNDFLKNNLMKIKETLTNRKTSRIFIVGSLASGKSSIINALLEESVIPIGNLFRRHYPCTFMYGAKSDAILYFKDEISSNEIECLPQAVKEYVLANGVSKIPSLQITFDKFEEYTTPNLQGDGYSRLPYSKIKIRIPNDLLKNRLEITEYNPLGHTKSCIEQLCADDIVIMTLNACAICSKDEMDFIVRELKARGITPIFVITHFDLIKNVEKALIQKFAEDKLSAYSPYDILFVSTNQAIDGLEENDTTLYDKSNIESLKVLLSSIIRQRNLTFLTHLAEEMRRNLLPYTLVGDAIEENLDSQKLEKIPFVNTIELDYNRQFISDGIKYIVERNNGELEYISRKLEYIINEHFYVLSEQIPCWIDSYTVHFVLPTLKNIQQLIQGISSFIENKIRDNIQEWVNGTLNREIEQMFLSYRLHTEEFLLELYKNLNDHYPLSTINTITSCRTKQIKEGFFKDNVLPSFSIKWEDDYSPFVGATSIVGCLIMPLFQEPFFSINNIKARISALYREYVAKKSPTVISNVVSETRSCFEDFNHAVSVMIQEDIDFLDYCRTNRDNLALSSVMYKEILTELDSYIDHMLSTQF